jgi:hypothetical protein
MSVQAASIVALPGLAIRCTEAAARTFGGARVAFPAAAGVQVRPGSIGSAGIAASCTPQPHTDADQE